MGFLDDISTEEERADLMNNKTNSLTHANDVMDLRSMQELKMKDMAELEKALTNLQSVMGKVELEADYLMRGYLLAYPNTTPYQAFRSGLQFWDGLREAMKEKIAELSEEEVMG